MLWKLNTTLSIVLAAALVVGCSSGSKKQAAAPPTPAERAMNQLAADRDAYVRSTQAKIDNMDAYANTLRAQSASTDRVRAKKMQNASEDLRSLLNDVRAELADVRASAPQNWVDEKRDVEKTLSRAETQYSSSTQLLR